MWTFDSETIRAIMGGWRANNFGLSLPDDPAVLRKWLLLAHGDYAAAKYAIAHAICPRSVVEVGVGWGVAAWAFLSGSPDASYVGYDDGSMDRRTLAFVRAANPPYKIIEADSRTLTELPACDLCHIDGGHEYETCKHDVSLALRAAKWVLVDDARDSQVAAATFAAVFEWRPGDVEWAYFPEGAGNILIKT